MVFVILMSAVYFHLYFLSHILDLSDYTFLAQPQQMFELFRSIGMSFSSQFIVFGILISNSCFLICIARNGTSLARVIYS